MSTMMAVPEFCRLHGISRAMFYKLMKEGRGPRVTKVGSRTLIGHEAAEEWRRQMERGTKGPEAA